MAPVFAKCNEPILSLRLLVLISECIQHSYPSSLLRCSRKTALMKRFGVCLKAMRAVGYVCIPMWQFDGGFKSFFQE